MTEAVFLVLVAALFGAIGKLWVDLRSMVVKLDEMIRKHAECEIRLAVLSGKVDMSRMSIKQLQQTTYGHEISTPPPETKPEIKEDGA